MQLQYHQATLDILTKDPIDPRPYWEMLLQLRQEFKEDGEPPFEPPMWTTFELFQYQPQASSTNVEKLNAFEHTFNVSVPASIREWYSLDIGVPLLNVNDAWYVFAIEDWELGSRANGYALTDSTLFFMIEQQSGDWCIKLDEGDDPPVYWIDPGSSTPRLRQVAPKFSDFVYCFLWDWFMNYKSLYGIEVWSIESELVPKILRLDPLYHVPLAHLQAQFQEIPQQWIHKHRFCSETQRFLMHCALNSESMLSGGEFYADSEEALRDLIRRIWGENFPLKHMETKQYPRDRPTTEHFLQSLQQHRL